MKIVFATHNRHKVDEVNQLVKDLPIEFLSLKDIGWNEEIVEDGLTMRDNAWIKTNTVYEKIGGNVISDDSGLEVLALDGKPGVHSARYAGEHKSDQDNLELVLKNMKSRKDRRAQFRAVLALILHGKKQTFEGIVKGHLTETPIGAGGFGYDPIFVPEGFENTFGVLPAHIKNQLSHRSKAFLAFREYLLKTIS